MGKSKRRAGEASSSHDPHDDEPRDLRADFNCPFLIRNDLEGRFYERWQRFEITPPHTIDWILMARLRCDDALAGYLSVLGLKKYADMSNLCSKVLTYEFLSTLEVPSNLSYCEFRLKDVTRRLSVAQLSRLMGFHPPSVAETSLPSNFNPNLTWTTLTGFHNWDKGGMLAGFLKDNVLSILHKFLAYAITGKEEANKINLHELYLLHCATNNIRIYAGYYLLLTFKNMLATTRYHATLPLVISAIGHHFGVFDPENVEPSSDTISCSKINFSELKHAKIINSDYTWCPARRRQCVQNHVNRLQVAAANPPHATEDDDLFGDAEYEDEPMPDTFVAGTSSGTHPHGPGSSSSGDIAQLSANVHSLRTKFGDFYTDFRAFRQDFGEFRSDIYQRQDRVEQQVLDTHTLVTDHHRQWQLAQEQAAETNRLVTSLHQQWANWSFNPHPPPPDQQ